ncbi:MAG: putative aminohydrolase SsnA [Haliangiales bacterium]
MPAIPAHGHVNAHTHIYSALVPLGMPAPTPPPENFLQILARVWWRLDRALDAEIIRASARLYVAEALLAGTTGLIDHHESPEFIDGSLDVIADVCQDLGMPAVLCYGATERNGGADEARAGIAECVRFARANQRPLVRAAVGLHASFTVSDDTIRAAAAAARDDGLVLHLHMAEDGADVDDAKTRGYDSPLDRLAKLDALIPGSILAHGVHLRADEIEQAQTAGLWLVQNPRSNQGNRVGYAGTLKHSAKVALGTDGYPADMQTEERALLAAAAEHGDDMDRARARLAAGHSLLAACFGGSGPKTHVEASAADPAATPPTPARAQRVTVDDRLVVDHGRLVAADITELRAHAQTQAQRLWPRMETR